MFLTKLRRGGSKDEATSPLGSSSPSSAATSSSNNTGVVSFLNRTLGRSTSNKDIGVVGSTSPVENSSPLTLQRRKPTGSPNGGGVSSATFTSTPKRTNSTNDRTYSMDDSITTTHELVEDGEDKRKILDEEEKERLKIQQAQQMFNSLMQQSVYKQIMEEDRYVSVSTLILTTFKNVKTSDQRALHLSDSQIQEEIDLLIGKDWESKKGKQECELFRKNMSL